MSVYVDDGFCGPAGSWGKWTGGGHMQADALDELHAFAARLGLRREWFQAGSRPEAAHYDLTRASHSAKPEAFLDMVETVSPAPRLEMFARRARFGWDYWGDESLGTAEMVA